MSACLFVSWFDLVVCAVANLVVVFVRVFVCVLLDSLFVRVYVCVFVRLAGGLYCLLVCV